MNSRTNPSGGGNRADLTRRDWLGATTVAGIGVALAATRPAAAADDEKIPIVDTHQHLWDLARFRLAWLKGNKALDRSFTTADYLEATEGLHFQHAVYMEVDVVAEQKAAEAEFVIEICKEGKSPTVAGVIGGDILKREFEAYIRKFADSKAIKGVRHIIAGIKDDKLFQNELFHTHIKLLGKLGLRFDLCTRPDQLADAAEFVRQSPGTQFVLDHCGNADVMAFQPEAKRARAADHEAGVWQKGIEAIAKAPNVVCKLSGIIARVEKDAWKPEDLKPIIDHCIEQFGVDRVTFASDWPVCLLGASLKQWTLALQQLTLTRGREAQRKIFHDNAVRFYGLDAKTP